MKNTQNPISKVLHNRRALLLNYLKLLRKKYAYVTQSSHLRRSNVKHNTREHRNFIEVLESHKRDRLFRYITQVWHNHGTWFSSRARCIRANALQTPRESCFWHKIFVKYIYIIPKTQVNILMKFRWKGIMFEVREKNNNLPYLWPPARKDPIWWHFPKKKSYPLTYRLNKLYSSIDLPCNIRGLLYAIKCAH